MHRNSYRRETIYLFRLSEVICSVRRFKRTQSGTKNYCFLFLIMLFNKYFILPKIHTGEKPYTCTISVCKKSFNQSSGLRAHMKSHTGERNYICLLCNKGFTQSSSLGRHMKTHSIFIPTVNATV